MKTKPKIDNRGMTLVELLVAVVILGIIVVPLLHTIVTGATTERKSRVAGEATATAQDILETIEASDAERILTDAGTVAKGAKYYTKANGTFTAATTTAPENAAKEYYIGIENIKNGSSTFDALVTLNASGGVYNEKEVTVSNPMDASINLMGADTIALAKFNALFQEHFDSPVAQNYIPREIEIDVTKPETDGSDFDITVNFNYTGGFTYTVEDKDGKKTEHEVPFADTETASARVSAKSGETPSVYLFFNAYYVQDDYITINNTTGTDVNFFLVNANTWEHNGRYKLYIEYKNQISKEPRVFTNIKKTDAPVAYTYRAFDKNGSSKDLTLSGLLVENKILQRQFATTVQVFKPNSNFTGDPILSIDASKLN